MTEEELHQLIAGCVKQDRKCQKMLYKAFYGYGMAICLRYTGDRDEAAGVLNQGFFKIFSKIDSYDAARPFKAWLGRIMMNVSIDNYRANLKMAYTDDIDEANDIGNDELATGNLNYNDLLAMVQRLPQSYRTVFNLFAIDGYAHEEIAEMLNISTGTSKSNLHKARQKLKQMILDAEAAATKINYTRGSGSGYSPIVAISGSNIRSVFNNGIK